MMKATPPALAESFGMSVIEELLDAPLVKEQKHRVPYLFAKENALLPFDEDPKFLHVAISDPLNLPALQELHLMLGKKIKPYFCLRATVETAIEKCYRKEEAPGDLLMPNPMAAALKETEGYDLLASSSSSPVVSFLNAVLSEAILQGASDVHFEPFEERMTIRYRIDGVLQKRHAPEPEIALQLIARIKVMSQMDIAEHRLPQDGRIKLRMGAREIDFRVSTIPVASGERVVLRILDKGNVMLGMERLGMAESILRSFQKIIHRPEGIVLVTGPTGSGKTTTLYSAITEINSPEINIMTIEDPIEYKLSGIAQMGVNPKIRLNFATGLRHILRQDPDVIMIGEIRDLETAEIAIQAALTGHLVLSTLHTNDAASALVRLSDMGIESYLLSSSIVAVLAQRLVRQICPHCKTSYRPSKKEIEEIQIDPGSFDGNLYYGTGCPQCFNSGYKGRIGIYELMSINPAIRHQMMQSVDAHLIRQIAGLHKEFNLRYWGNILAARGITTAAEVLRATKLAGEV